MKYVILFLATFVTLMLCSLYFSVELTCGLDLKKSIYYKLCKQ